MDDSKVLPILEKVSAEIADFTIGFARIVTYGETVDALPAGSGSLVAIGRVAGILTAAHVLANLPDHEDVGIVRFPRSATQPQRMKINMDHAEKLMIAGDAFGVGGPDLGFLRLPPSDVATLNARNVFFNLERRAEMMRLGMPTGRMYFEGLSGMIAMWTTDLPPERPLIRLKGFRALFGVGLVHHEYEEVGGFDYLDFETVFGQGLSTPENFAGMSGGALWRICCIDDGGDQLTVIDKVIRGVAFYQSDLIDQQRTIRCHGPKSIYGALVAAIHKKWPDSI